jgi:hypothetical protein
MLIEQASEIDLDVRFTLYVGGPLTSWRWQRLQDIVNSWYTLGTFRGFGQGGFHSLDWLKRDEGQDGPIIRWKVDVG